MRWLIIISVLCALSFSNQVSATPVFVEKKQDTVKQKIHSPVKATYLAILPGAGQIYNKKYWKLPIVYAGFAVTGYFGLANRKLYKQYGEAYLCKVGNSNCTNELAQKYSEQDLITIRDYYRRNMELSFIIMGGWYIFQMLDAVVDANLYNWEISNNLSLSVQPVLQPPTYENRHAFNGFSIKVTF